MRGDATTRRRGRDAGGRTGRVTAGRTTAVHEAVDGVVQHRRLKVRHGRDPCEAARLGVGVRHGTELGATARGLDRHPRVVDIVHRCTVRVTARAAKDVEPVRPSLGVDPGALLRALQRLLLAERACGDRKQLRAAHNTARPVDPNDLVHRERHVRAAGAVSVPRPDVRVETSHQRQVVWVNVRVGKSHRPSGEVEREPYTPREAVAPLLERDDAVAEGAEDAERPAQALERQPASAELSDEHVGGLLRAEPAGWHVAGHQIVRAPAARHFDEPDGLANLSDWPRDVALNAPFTFCIA
jgi:hypothetical protein